jgi:putative ABC transport system permease protein
LGRNAAVFSVINAVLLRPLPFSGSGQLVQIWESHPVRGEVEQTVSPWNFMDWQKHGTSLAQLAVYEYESLGSCHTWRSGANGRRSRIKRLYSVLPGGGRSSIVFARRRLPGSHSVVLSYKGWTSHFNSDPHIVGKGIMLDGEPFTVIGVMPAGFRFPALGTDLWTTLAFDLTSEADHVLGLHPKVDVQ